MIDAKSYKIRLGLDAAPLNNLSGGIGYYVFYLLDELIQTRKDILFILYSFSDEGDIFHFTKYENVEIRKIPFLSFCHSLWIQSTLCYHLWKEDLDYFWGTTQSLPLLTRKRLVTLLSLYDFVFRLHPKTLSPIKGLYLAIFSKRFFKKADFIFPISYGTGEYLKSFYGIAYADVVNPPLRKDIAYKDRLACETVLQRENLPYKKYVVTVGTIEPRKNFLGLLAFYASLLQKHDPSKLLPLVIIGGGGWKNKKIKRELQKLSQEYPRQIVLLGFIPDADLSYYLSGASFYVSLSHYEGYGMPLAESRVCQTPIVCFDRPEMREAAENDGVFLSEDFYKESLEEWFFISEDTAFPSVTRAGYISNRTLSDKISKQIL